MATIMLYFMPTESVGPQIHRSIRMTLTYINAIQTRAQQHQQKKKTISKFSNFHDQNTLQLKSKMLM